jgi:hypothetical protein
METWNTIVGQLDISRWNIVYTIANTNGRSEKQVEIRLLIILGYIVIVLLLMFIHRTLLRKEKKTHENLVILYDVIRYQVARAQYENSSIEGDGIQTIINTEHKEYVENAATIKQEILSIEKRSGQDMVTEKQRKTIHQQTKKKNRLTKLVKYIGRTLTILTVGIYKLFW